MAGIVGLIEFLNISKKVFWLSKNGDLYGKQNLHFPINLIIKLLFLKKSPENIEIDEHFF